MNKKVVHTVFESKAKEHAHRNALEWDGDSMSYQQLNLAANQFAHLLKHLGVDKESLCAALLDEGHLQVATMLGIFKSGAIYVPLDTRYGENHWRQLFDQLQPKAMVVTPSRLQTVEHYHPQFKHSIPWIIVAEWDTEAGMSFSIKKEVNGSYQEIAVPAKLETTNPDNDINGDDSNYIFFTSGSTGIPKAVLGAHKSLSHFVHWESKELGITPEDRVGQLTSFSFDASLRDIFVPLINGATLCLPGKERKEDISQFVKWLSREQITLLHTVPTLFRLMTVAARALSMPSKLSDLRYLLLAGEKLYHRDILEWREVAGDATQIINLYGATESTLVKTFYRIPITLLGSPSDVLPVGQPISNTALILLNASGQLCRIGEKGSIYIKTPFLSKGYFKAEEATAAVFVQNPLTDDPDVIYRTGDYGTYDSDRNVIVLGREDGLVKINGVRADLNAIEQNIRSAAKVTDVKCLLHPTSELDSQLVCFYIAEEERTDELKQYCSIHLSGYELPAYFIHMKEFPTNINGKTDSKALAAMVKERIRTTANFIAPLGATEERLADLWEDVLDTERIGRNDDFLHLGGNSIKLIRLKSRIYREFQSDVGLQQLFLNSTLQEMAQMIDGHASEGYEGIVPIAPQESYDLSPAQYRIWVLSQFEGASQAYNIATNVPVEGPIDMKRFQTAIRQTIARHEILRTVFKENPEGKLQQWVIPVEAVSFELEYQDFQRTSDPAKAADNYHNSAAAQPFDLAQWPLMRAGLLKVSEDEYQLSFIMHHIIGDAWSMGLLSDEVMQQYRNTDEAMPPLAIQYKDFAAWQTQQLSGDRLQRHKEFWLNQLGGEIAVNELPTNKLRPAVKSSNGETLNTVIAAEDVDGLRAFSTRHGGTLFMGLLMAFKVLVYRFTGETDSVIGSPVAGRPHESLEDQIGFYINTLVLRDVIDGNHTFKELFEQVK
ncbi:MAG: condensation domain-containing protein, partial [Bacteroidota bacterium]